MTRNEAIKITGGLSKPSKMPCHSYSIPASLCNTGGKLRKVKGSVCEGCYAMKGRYYFGNVQRALYKRYEALRNPKWVDAMVVLIEATKNPHFRWHDSGDVQGEWHLAKICAIAKALPHVKFWLPTKEYKLMKQYFAKHPKPSNLTVRVSLPMVDQVTNGREGFPVSQVHTSPDKIVNAIECISRTQGHKCLDCRACWDESIHSVSYLAH